MQCACACVHVYVRGLHALEDLLGVDFRPCTRPQRADAPAFAHPLIITHVRAHMFNDTRCNTCVRACRWRTWCCALTATSCRCCTTCTSGVGFRPSARPQRGGSERVVREVAGGIGDRPGHPVGRLAWVHVGPHRTGSIVARYSAPGALSQTGPWTQGVIPGGRRGSGVQHNSRDALSAAVMRIEFRYVLRSYDSV